MLLKHSTSNTKLTIIQFFFAVKKVPGDTEPVRDQLERNPIKGSPLNVVL